MSNSILRDWLTKANIKWEREEKLEDAFCNGYLIGKLLCNLEIGGLNQEEFEYSFVNDVTIDQYHEYEYNVKFEGFSCSSWIL